MMSIFRVLALVFLLSGNTFCIAQTQTKAKQTTTTPGKISKTKAEWKKQLSPQEYYVMFEEGTERSFSGKYWNNHKTGTYLCNACKLPLFSSDTKFESGTGWPSFFAPLAKTAVEEITDSDGMRTEVQCARCTAHLGHVFDDGPKPTGLRYCMNSVSLDFKEK